MALGIGLKLTIVCLNLSQRNAETLYKRKSHGGDLKQKILFIILSSFLLASARANERYEFYNGIRALSMGGASVATVNDETSLLVNPAALGKLRNFFLTVVDPEVEMGDQTAGVIGSSYADFLDPQKTLDATKLHPNSLLHERAQLFPSFVVTNFGFGVYGRVSTDASVVDSTFNYEYRNDYAFVTGFNFRLFDGIIKLGVNARIINRVESKRTDIPLATTLMDFETVINSTSVASEGTGIASDGGLILTLPWVFLPALAVAYHDMGTTSYDINKGMFYTTTQRPERTPPTLDGGISISPILSNGIRMVITAEMVDILDRVEPADEEESDEVMRRIHGGIEVNFNDIFFLRGGLNQGYWTAGVEVSINNSQFQLGSYGEEVGDIIAVGSTATYTKVEDRRYVAKYAFRF